MKHSIEANGIGAVAFLIMAALAVYGLLALVGIAA